MPAAPSAICFEVEVGIEGQQASVLLVDQSRVVTRGKQFQ